VNAVGIITIYFNKSIIMKKLNLNELNELKGGVSNLTATGDVKNTNNVSGCLCTFLDNSEVLNSNTVTSCKCSCRTTTAS